MSRRPPHPREAPWRRARARRLGTRSALSGYALVAVSPLALDYVVQPGDTVSQIAAEHGTSTTRVVEANDLPAGGDSILAGEVLRIPAAHRPAAGGDSRAATAAAASDWHDDGRRRVEWHRVRPGDTMTAIAERYHAWTDELVAANGGNTDLVVGERVKVPVVVAAARAAEQTPGEGRGQGTGQTTGESDGATAASPARVRRLRTELSGYPDPPRPVVRRLVARVAERAGVDPDLALAISWQEAGWRQHHVSPDAAIGAMQVIPATGSWISGVVGRDLDLMRVRDNVTAGVTLLAQLTDAADRRHAVAGYYQGLAGVRTHGMYDDTRAYVANVLALQRAFSRGDYPR
ncbi:MAG: LysM peptidoglycan-binding domain-containing protein [Actinomycetota bacterium]|nr:LysM peptidoglycan-binding domain-containing protein [Actinomycetota bacterium]